MGAGGKGFTEMLSRGFAELVGVTVAPPYRRLSRGRLPRQCPLSAYEGFRLFRDSGRIGYHLAILLFAVDGEGE